MMGPRCGLEKTNVYSASDNGPISARPASRLPLTVAARGLVFLAASAAAASPTIFLAAMVGEDVFVYFPFLALSGLLAASVTTVMIHLLIRQRVGFFFLRVLLLAEVGAILGVFPGLLIFGDLLGSLLGFGRRPADLDQFLMFIGPAAASILATRRGYPVEIPTPSKVGINKSAAAVAMVALAGFALIAALRLPDPFPCRGEKREALETFPHYGGARVDWGHIRPGQGPLEEVAPRRIDFGERLRRSLEEGGYGCEAGFVATAPPEAVLDYYRKELMARGWSIEAEASPVLVPAPQPGPFESPPPGPGVLEPGSLLAIRGDLSFEFYYFPETGGPERGRTVVTIIVRRQQS